MGLLYVLPTSIKEEENCQLIKNTGDHKSTLLLKSYGLPPVFYAYAAATLLMVCFLFLASRDLYKIFYTYESFWDHLLAYAVDGMFLSIPLSFVAFFTYHKQIKVKDHKLQVSHKVIGLPFWSKTIPLKDEESFEIKHYLDSPNLARLNPTKEMRAFENQGYYELWALDKRGQRHRIDRHSQKRQIKNLEKLFIGFLQKSSV